MEVLDTGPLTLILGDQVIVLEELVMELGELTLMFRPQVLVLLIQDQVVVEEVTILMIIMMPVKLVVLVDQVL